MSSSVEETTSASWREIALRCLMILVPLLVAACGTVAYLYWHTYQDEVATVVINQSDLVVLLNNSVRSDFALIASDLQALATQESEALRTALADEDRDEAYAQVGAHFQSFLLRRGGFYEQVRLLDHAGKPLLQARWTPGDAGQGTTESSQESDATNEHSQRPLGPTIQFTTPLFMGAKTPRGAIVVDYSGNRLLQRLIAGTNLVKELSLTRVNVASDVSLLDGNGNRMIGADPKDPSNLVFIQSGQPNSSFSEQLPIPWKKIAASPAGQFRYPEGMFTFRGFSASPAQVSQPSDAPPADGDPTPSWKLISHIHPEVFTAWRRQMIEGILRWSALLAILLFVGSWLFAAETVERQRSAAGMKRNEERFRQLAEHIDEVFWIASADGEQLIYVSSPFETLWGRSLKKLYARPQLWVEAIHPEDRDRRSSAFNEVSEKGHFEVDYRILRPDGETRWIRERGFAIRNSNGVVYRAAGIARDTTALRDAQDHVLRSERLSAVGEAMTGLAHESRNALQRSQAGLEMLAARLQDRPESMELLSEVQKSQDYLHELYEEVRDYARPINVRRNPVDMRAILCETWEQLQQQRNGHSDQLVEEPIGINLECDADARAVGQVLRNVLENAIAAADDPVKIRVEWSETQLDGQPALQVSIHDNGPGMTAEQVRKIFTPFFTTKTQGTGLGMAISKRIIDAHQGEIAVNPSARPGANIVITLPRRIA